MPTTTAHLHLGARMSEPLEIATGAGQVFVFARPCPPGEGDNQDSVAVIVLDDGRLVLAVADGVGGIPGGRQASARALQVFAKTVHAGITRGGGLREAILDGFETANRAVLEVANGGCTTIAVAAIRDGAVRCYHVGDSAILAVGQRGRLKHATVAHSPVGYAVEAGLLDESEAMSHEERNVVSNVLGSPLMKIEIGPPVRLAARDTIVVASDGVFDNLSQDEIIDVVRAGPLRGAAQRLAAVCAERMTGPNGNRPHKPDDTSFVLYRPEPPTRRGRS